MTFDDPALLFVEFFQAIWQFKISRSFRLARQSFGINNLTSIVSFCFIILIQKIIDQQCISFFIANVATLNRFVA